MPLTCCSGFHAAKFPHIQLSSSCSHPAIASYAANTLFLQYMVVVLKERLQYGFTSLMGPFKVSWHGIRVAYKPMKP